MAWAATEPLPDDNVTVCMCECAREKKGIISERPRPCINRHAGIVFGRSEGARPATCWYRVDVKNCFIRFRRWTSLVRRWRKNGLILTFVYEMTRAYPYILYRGAEEFKRTGTEEKDDS